MQKDIQNLLGCETNALKEKQNEAPPVQPPKQENQLPQVGMMLKRVSSIQANEINVLNEDDFKKALQGSLLNNQKTLPNAPSLQTS